MVERYIALVRGTADTHAEHPLFLFDPRFWGFGDNGGDDGGAADRDDGGGDTLARERSRSARGRSVRVYKLSKSFKASPALQEVSLTMERGACFVLLGQNGAGKTTLIGTLTGLYNPTHGAAFVAGRDIAREVVRCFTRLANRWRHVPVASSRC